MGTPNAVREPRVVIFGLDVGQEGDPSAIAVGERLKPPAPRGVAARYRLGHLERIPLGTKYQDAVDYLGDLVYHQQFVGARRFVVVDATGVGRPVMEMADERLFHRKPVHPESSMVDLVGVTITAGGSVTVASGDLGAPRFPWLQLNVPKRDIVTALSVVLQGQRIDVADSPDSGAWSQEMATFRRKVRRVNETYEAEKDAQHDDLVMASAEVVWFGEFAVGEIGGSSGPGSPNGPSGAIRAQLKLRV